MKRETIRKERHTRTDGSEIVEKERKRIQIEIQTTYDDAQKFGTTSDI